jgi:ankyrin repeat protein
MPRRNLIASYTSLRRSLEEQQGDIDDVDILIAAAHALDAELVAYIGQKVGINTAKDDRNALFWVAGTDDVRAAEILIAAGSSVNALRAGAPTPLMHAAYWNRLPMAQLLLAKGAQADYKDTESRSALTIARERGYAEMVHLLSEAVAQ